MTNFKSASAQNAIASFKDCMKDNSSFGDPAMIMLFDDPKRRRLAALDLERRIHFEFCPGCETRSDVHQEYCLCALCNFAAPKMTSREDIVAGQAICQECFKGQCESNPFLAEMLIKDKLSVADRNFAQDVVRVAMH